MKARLRSAFARSREVALRVAARSCEVKVTLAVSSLNGESEVEVGPLRKASWVFLRSSITDTARAGVYSRRSSVTRAGALV